MTSSAQHPRMHPGMFRRLAAGILLSLVFVGGTAPACAADGIPVGRLHDLYFGAALFDAYSDHYFDAIRRLDTELAQYYALDDPSQDTLSYHREEAELFIGDLELDYRMQGKVGRAMTRLLNKSVHESIRNQAAYRLARIAYEKGEYPDTLELLARITPKAPHKLQVHAALLKGEALISMHRDDEAITVLRTVQNEKGVAAYAALNLGIAAMQDKKFTEAYKELDRVGTLSGDSREINALRDKANLTMGFTLLSAKKPDKARPFLDRIHLKGPFSNKALLWVGWADAADGHYDRALVPWSILRKRDVTDVAVQESMLAVPYGYSKLKAYGKAAVLYGDAVKTFDGEIKRLDDSIRSIREGKFLAAMLDVHARHDPDWLIHLRSLPDAPETRYLRQLMTGHIFQQSYENYRDLNDLRDNVQQWLNSIPAYFDLIRHRRAYFAPRLARIDADLKRMDARLAAIGDEHDRLQNKLKSLMTHREPMALATGNERQWLGRLSGIDREIARLRPQRGRKAIATRLAFLQGILDYRIAAAYDTRLSTTFVHLRELEQSLKQAGDSRRNLARERAEAALSYQGYDKVLQDLQQRLQYLKTKLDGLIAYQGQYMERAAITELEWRKSRLKRYRTKARFALAESYDRASREAAAPEKKK
jgi:predicted negative regulator of RcsB-dependent stress response